MDNIQKSPWLGLMSYEEKDAHLFYGRTNEIQELSGDIFNNTQTIVYGPSGTGKTSIIKAGIFSLARSNNFLPIYIRLNHDSKESYSFQIIEKIQASLKEIDGEIENLIEPICENNCSLWEFFHGNEFWNKENYPVVPLIVIDQFEEIFTLTKDKSIVNDFFIQLSDLCDNKMPQTVREYLNSNSIRREYSDNINYRLVLSLREDFLARLEEFAVNIPSLRRNRFSLQAINEEQAMEIILKPSKGMVSEDVAIEIIKKVTNNANFKIDGIPEITVETALLSLFCNELNKKRLEDGLHTITFDLLERFGDNIISDFYESTMGLISESSMLYLENSLLTKKGYRDSIALGDAFEYGVTPYEIDILQQNRLIHVDEWDGTKRIEFTHDVLCKIAKEKRDKRRDDQQLKQLEYEQQKQKRKNKILTNSLILGVIIILMGCFGGYTWYKWYFVDEYEEYYGILIKKRGHFEGREQLTKEVASHRSYYYKLTKKGKGAKYFSKIFAMNGYHKLTTNHTMGAYLLNQFDDDDLEADSTMKDKLKTVCWWEMVFDASGEFVVQERAYKADSSIVYCFNNTRLPNGKVMSFYSDEFGLPIKLRKSDANYLLITYDKRGFEVAFEFYDRYGYPQPNKDSAYKTIKDYNDDGLQIMEASLDVSGNKMIDRWGNCGWETKYDKYRKISGVNFNEKWQPCKAKDSIVIHGGYSYDQWGNQTSESYFDVNGKPTLNNKKIHKCIGVYNEKGKIIEYRYYGVDGKLKSHGDKIAIVKMDYDSNGNQILFELLDANHKYINNESGVAKYISKYSSAGELINEVTYIERNGLLEITESMKFDSIKLERLTYFGDIDVYIRKKYDKQMNNIYWAYFDNKNDLPIEQFGYHSSITKYIYGKKTIQSTEEFKNKIGEIVTPEGYSYSKIINKFDSINNRSLVLMYNKTDLVNGYERILDEKGFPISQKSIGVCGLPVRRNGNDGAFYYKANVDYNLKHSDISFFSGVNEFDEPSYIVNSAEAFWKKRLYIKNDSSCVECFDENGKKINDMTIFKNNLPYSVHCEIDSANNIAYKVGIRDGDILIGYGNWNFTFENPNLNFLISEIGQLKEKEKDIKVMRHIPSKKESRTLTFRLPKGLSGIHFTPIYYTNKEKDRLETVLKTGYWKGK